MSARRASQRGTARQVIASAIVGIGSGILMRQFTEWQWWIRYPLILAAVFVTAVVVEAVSQRRARSRS